MSAKKRPNYYTPNEVSLHCTLKDCWVSFLGKVYDLAPVLGGNKGDVLLKPIIAAAGTDISHWFNPKTKDIRRCVDPTTGCEVYFTPHGRFIHCPPNFPCSKWANDFGRPWWKDEQTCIGVLSKKTRFVRIINTMTSQESTLEVCSEENMHEILRRYLRYNQHAGSYTWKYNGRNLEMDMTLEQNGVQDDDEDFYELRMDLDEFLQSLHLYFNDDLTEA